MTVSERLWSCSGPSPLAHHGDLRSSQWSKLQKFHRPPFDWTAKRLLWCSLRCVEWKATTVTAGEFYVAVILKIFMLLWVRPSFIHKTHALNSVFSNYLVKKFRFIIHNSAGFYQTFHFHIPYETKQTSSKSVKFDFPIHFSLKTIADWELWRFDNFDSSSIVQPIGLFESF